jgi:hypothetical protein
LILYAWLQDYYAGETGQSTRNEEARRVEKRRVEEIRFEYKSVEKRRGELNRVLESRKE